MISPTAIPALVDVYSMISRIIPACLGMTYGDETNGEIVRTEEILRNLGQKQVEGEECHLRDASDCDNGQVARHFE
jgi:hypothetical protein